MGIILPCRLKRITVEEGFLISALSLFSGASLLPASLLILRDRVIPIDRQHRIEGGLAILMGFVLMSLGAMFLLNTVAQDRGLLIALVILLVVLPYGIIVFDKRRGSTN